MGKSVRINFDGGCSPTNPGEMTIGFVARERRNRVKTESKRIGFGTSNIAEMASAYAAVRWAHANGYTRVLIIGDSKIAVHCLAERWRARVPHLIQIKERFLAFVNKSGMRVKLLWVPRERNEEADQLTRDCR